MPIFVNGEGVGNTVWLEQSLPLDIIGDIMRLGLLNTWLPCKLDATLWAPLIFVAKSGETFVPDVTECVTWMCVALGDRLECCRILEEKRLLYYLYKFKLIFKFKLMRVVNMYLDCLLGVKGDPWLIWPKFKLLLPLIRQVSMRFLGGSSWVTLPRVLFRITSNSSSQAGLFRFLSSRRKYMTFSVLWLKNEIRWERGANWKTYNYNIIAYIALITLDWVTPLWASLVLWSNPDSL